MVQRGRAMRYSHIRRPALQRVQPYEHYSQRPRSVKVLASEAMRYGRTDGCSKCRWHTSQEAKLSGHLVDQRDRCCSEY